MIICYYGFYELENQFGIYGMALAWLKSYLSERTQRVSYTNTTSKFTNVNYGAPQGSILGPLFFLIFLFLAKLYAVMELISTRTLMILSCMCL